MLILLRIFFTSLLLYVAGKARAYSTVPQMSTDLTVPGYFALCVVLGIATAIVWAPWIGAMVSEPITSTYTKGEGVPGESRLTRSILWFENHRHRRLALSASFIAGVIQPRQPAAFIIGLRNSREGSWLQKAFAREAYRFNHAQHSIAAREILRRHGTDPGPHPNEEVRQILATLDLNPAPDREPVPVPVAEKAPLPGRNQRIQLFESPPKTAARLPAADGKPSQSA